VTSTCNLSHCHHHINKADGKRVICSTVSPFFFLSNIDNVLQIISQLLTFIGLRISDNVWHRVSWHFIVTLQERIS